MNNTHTPSRRGLLATAAAAALTLPSLAAQAGIITPTYPGAPWAYGLGTGGLNGIFPTDGLKLLGDSIIAQHYDTTPPHLSYGNNGVWNVANQLLGAPFQSLPNYGVSGNTTTQIAARAGSVPAGGLCVVEGGINDILIATSAGNIATTVATILSNFTAICNALLGQKTVPILQTITPNSNVSANQVSMIINANRGIRLLAASLGLKCLDLYKHMVDPSSTVCAPMANMVRADGTHPTMVSAAKAGPEAAQILRELIGQRYLPPVGNADTRDVVGTDSNFLQNPALLGTSGTITANGATVTGTMPANWRLYNAGGDACSITINNYAYVDGGDMRGNWATTTIYQRNDCVMQSGVCYRCLEPHNSGTFATDLVNGFWEIELDTQGNWLEVVITGTSASTNVQIYPVNTLAVTRLSLGNYVQCQADIDVRGTPVALASTTLEAEINFSSAVGGYAAWSAAAGLQANAQAAIPLNLAWRQTLLTPKLYADPAGASISSANGQCFFANFIFNGSGSATIRIARPAAWQTAA